MMNLASVLTDVSLQMTSLRKEVETVRRVVDNQVLRTDMLMSHLEKLSGIVAHVPSMTSVVPVNITSADKSNATKNFLLGLCCSCVRIIAEAKTQGFMMSTPLKLIKYLTSLYLNSLRINIAEIASFGAPMKKDDMFNMGVSTVCSLLKNNALLPVRSIIDSVLSCFAGPMSPFVSSELYTIATTTRIDWSNGETYSLSPNSFPKKGKDLIGIYYERLLSMMTPGGSMSSVIDGAKSADFALSSFDWKQSNDSYISLAGSFGVGVYNANGTHFKNVDIRGKVLSQGSAAFSKQQTVHREEELSQLAQALSIASKGPRESPDSQPSSAKVVRKIFSSSIVR